MTDIESQMKEIVNRMRKHVDEVAEEELRKGLIDIIKIGLEEMEGFADVTGNTKNSLAVAVFHDGKPKGFYSSFDALHHAPTRVTLVRGETYDLDYYWDGTPVSAFPRPYTAPDGEDHYWANDEAEEFLRDKAPSKKGWCYIIVSAVEYAKYLEMRNSVNVLTQMHDEFEARGADVSEMRNG